MSSLLQAVKIIYQIRFLSLLVPLVTTLLATPNLRAQDPLTNATQIGFPINGVFDTDTFASVQFNNGNLHIEIPFLTLNGRGIPVTLAYVYDSKGWTEHVTSACNPDTGANCWSNIGKVSWDRMSPRLVGPLDYLFTYKTTGQTCGTTGGQYGYRLLNNFVLQEPNGTMHSFQPDGVSLDAYGGLCSIPMVGNMYADDGSGWVATMNPADQSVVARRKDGFAVHFTSTATEITDVNGNKIVPLTSYPSPFSLTDTLGRTVNFDGSYYDSQGQLRAIQTTTVPVSISTNLCQFATYQCTEFRLSSTDVNAPKIHTIVLPNGQTYTLEWVQNSHGELSSLTLPTGATISFTWAVTDLGGPSVKTKTVTVGGQSSTWTYFPTIDLSSGTSQITRVTNPVGNDTTFSYAGAVASIFQYYSGSSSTGQLVKTVRTDYLSLTCVATPQATQLPIRQTTTWNQQNLVSKVEFDYATYNFPIASGTTCPMSWGNITEKREYDFGSGAPGPLLRRTDYTYLHLQNSTYLQKNIADRPTSVIVYDGTGSIKAQSTTSYDGSALTTTANAPNHDYTNFGSSNLVRGNPTIVSSWLNTNSSWLSATTTYNDLGDLLSTTDPRNNTTNFSYADNFTDGVNRNAQAFVTQTTYPATSGVSHIERKQYYWNTSLPAASCGQNFPTASACTNTASIPQPDYTSSTYDLMNRPLNITRGDGGQTNFSYNDTVQPLSISSAQSITSSSSLAKTTLLDGLGRIIQTQLTSDPDCSSSDKTDTTYDALGRVSTVSNPYCTTSDPTYGLTTYAYDTLGRTTQVTRPDNSTVLTSYAGRATQVQDEGNGTRRVSRVSQVDGLGRLASVCEVSSASLIGSGGTPGACGLDIAGTGFLTTYQYDALDNLVQVNQSGIAGRTFNYDSLSRLTSATNPESGTISYTYDPNGNLTTKTDARNITTTYSYDALNRLTQKSYSDGTATATFIYDSVSGFTSTNAIGRLVESTVPSSIGGYIATFSRYDPVGRTSFQLQLLPLPFGSYHVPYAYDLMGNMTSASNGWFNTYTYSYNPAARLTAVTDSISDAYDPPNILSNIQYNAGGQITSDTLGTGEVETYTYTKRNQLQAVSSVLNSTPIYSYSLTFAPNGNLTASNDSVNGNWNYSYDQFNRLVCSNLASNGTCSAPTNGTPTYSYVYDRFGNRWQQNGPNSFIATFTGNNPGSPANNNRMDGYSYDAAGNLLNEGTHSYFYDAENRLIQVDGSAGYCSTSTGTPATACYTYDANGYRIRSTGTPSCDGPGGMEYVYDIYGRRIMNVNSYDSSQGGNSGTACLWEIYAGNRHIGNQSGGIRFDHHDWLGTVRLMNSYQYPYVSQYVGETCTSLPFGDALTCVHPVDTIHFTGKERDAESGLDNFGLRYMGSNLGRFMSPDSIANDWELLNPQTWNRYAYARNNPLIYIDPDGAAVELICTRGAASDACAAQRQTELAAIQASLGNKDAASRLYINEVKDGDNTRYFVGIKGDVGDFMKLGDTSHDLANLVQDKQVVEFGLTKSDLSQWGGAVTYAPGEAPGGTNQNVRVLVNTEQAVDLASTILGQTVLGAGRMGGQNERPPWRIRDMTEGVAIWHEFGHGWGYIHGRTGSRSNQEAVDWENRMRKQVYGPIGPNNAPRVRD